MDAPSGGKVAAAGSTADSAAAMLSASSAPLAATAPVTVKAAAAPAPPSTAAAPSHAPPAGVAALTPEDLERIQMDKSRVEKQEHDVRATLEARMRRMMEEQRKCVECAACC